jgi:DNA-binding LacI/PurR family transcriptional regulator
MRANIRQVAERAGVSRTTVSNVLLGREHLVAPEKRYLVMQAVRELDYVPVRPTLQNRHAETRVIALALDDPQKVSWDFHSSTYRGLCEGAVRHGYDVLTLLRPDPEWANDRREVGLLDRRSDGVIFIAPDIGQHSTFEALSRRGIPTVACYRRDVPEGIAWVDPDNRGAMVGAVEHLVKHGHKSIAHLTKNDAAQFDFVQRCIEFVNAVHLFKLGRCAENIVTFEGQMSDVAHRVRELKITAVVCASDWLANHLWTALEEAGLQVPDDISLIGVDNAPQSAVRGLTTMAFSFAEVGSLATDALVAQITGERASDCCRVAPVHLVERQSVRSL